MPEKSAPKTPRAGWRNEPPEAWDRIRDPGASMPHGVLDIVRPMYYTEYMRNIASLKANPDRTWFTAEGHPMHPGDTVYRRKLDWGLQSGSSVKAAFGSYTALVGSSFPLTVPI